MKKNFILPAILLVSLSLFACSNKTVTQESDAIEFNDFYNSNVPTVKHNLNLKDFHGIENNGSIEVVYTQGNTYSVTFEGTQKAYDIYKFYVSNGILKVSVQNKKASSTTINGNVRLLVTAPNLDALNNKGGAMTIKADNWKAKGVRIENNGAMTLKTFINSTANISISNAGSLSYKDGIMTAQGISINNYGALTLKVPISTSGKFSLKNYGASKFTSKIKAKEYEESCQGASTDEVAILADNVDMNIDGAGKMSIDFKGKNANIVGNGCSTINLNTDCEKLTITSAGASKIKVKGTADDTTFNNSGVTKVDASELNKF